jgi:eukaryotic-like serine/threonine-protein kinase
VSERLAPLDDQIELRGLLGAGGMGEVHRAWDRRLERAVAVKLIRGHDTRDAERVLLEARLQARVEHPHVVKVHAVGSLDGRPCIVFQLVEGRTLSDLAPSLSIEQRVELVRQAGLGLHAAHLQGLVHRDVKPANVLVEQARDTGPVALLTDFGLARGEEAGASRSGLPAGTLDYMSPEQLVAPGPPDFRSDVYALGATLYSVLAGHPPFRRSSPRGTPSTESEPDVELLRRILEEDPEPLTRLVPGLPRDLATIASRAMEKDPTARYGSAEALAADLGRVQRGEPIHARPVSLVERALKWSRRNTALARAAGVVALTLLLAAGWTWWHQRRADRAAVEAARLGALSESLEDQLRMEYLGPPHDLRPALQRLRHEAERLRAHAATGDGASNAALGKALQLTGDAEGARAAYERAWRTGFRTPRVAEGLGEVLGELYRRKYERARETLAADAREPAFTRLRAELAEPAKAYLRMGESSGWRAGMVAAREAMVERDFPGARRRAQETLAADPGRYEALLLTAQAWIGEARDLTYARRFDEVSTTLEKATAVLEDAARWGRSDPAVGLALAEIHSVRSNIETLQGRSPLAATERALAALDTVAVLDPDDPAVDVGRGFAHVQQVQYLFMGARSSLDATLDAGISAYRRALAVGGDDARTLSLLGQALYYRAFAQEQEGKPSLDAARAGLEAMDRAERLAPEDSEVPFVRGILHAAEADALQRAGQPTAAARRAAVEAGRRALEMHAGRGILLRPIVAQQLVLLGKEAWLNGEDPRPHFDGARKAFDEALRTMPGQPAPVAQFANSVDVESSILLAIGEDPSPKLEEALAKVNEILAKRPGLIAIEALAAELLVDEAIAVTEHGGDPSALLARARPTLERAEHASPEDLDVQTSLAVISIAQARWQLGQGQDPSSALHRAEQRLQGLKRASADLVQEWLGRAALERARWLARSGKPTDVAAREGVEHVASAMKTRPQEPELWLLRAQLDVFAGEPAQARTSLEHAWGINPLCRGGQASHAAEALLATR